MPSPYDSAQILGINFYNDSLENALQFAHECGGLVLAPSGPGLADLGKNANYDKALQNADLNLIDSGYLAMLWKKCAGQNLRRHSGLKFIKALIECTSFKSCSEQLWVMPDEDDIDRTIDFLTKNGIALGAESFYAAPYYKTPEVTDEVLLNKIRKQRPKYIILAIAGGKQEVLGYWLRQQLGYRPAIICIGAAIAFLTGQQATIPTWADRIYIGWLLRILADPKAFFPRYWRARKLKSLVYRFGEKAPSSH